MSDVFVDEGGLEFNDPPRLAWVRVRDAAGLLWRENPKRHDLQKIVESVRKHAFQVPPKFDGKLFRAGQPPDDPGPLGAIKAGNGRVEALAWLEAHWDEVKEAGEGIPRGLATVRGTGEWAMPLLVGTDARSGSLAQAFAVDDNNLVLSGGDFDGFDMARLWDASYLRLLEGLDELPVSVDSSVLEALGTMLLDAAPEPPEDFPEYDESVEGDVEWIECPNCGHKWPA